MDDRIWFYKDEFDLEARKRIIVNASPVYTLHPPE